jgi:glutamate racemase
MKGIIQKVMGEDVKVIDPSLACALNLLSFLEKNGISSINSKPKYEFYTSGDTEKFKNIAEVFLEKKIDQVLKK